MLVITNIIQSSLFFLERFGMADFLSEYKKLTTGLFEADPNMGMPSNSYLGGQADLTPLRNKAREAMDALADAQRAADQGRVDDCLEYFRRAKAVMDIALGGQVGPYGAGAGVVPRP